ncbi:MAG: hypothetical protein COA36_10430 [Desulfotalea sp.]|nr:MAG: hypothetical protein COA36_10430 [Desulfotalea sp.]
MGASKKTSIALSQRLNEQQSIHFSVDSDKNREYLSTLPLFGETRGKMFGVLDCLTKSNRPVSLYAFSGQFNGQWYIDGWVPPLFKVETFHKTTYQAEKEIKALTREIKNTPAHSTNWLHLRKQRRTLSQSLMKEIHALYSLTNFRGETQPLTEIFRGKSNIPTGTGDCCAPKLLNFAAKNNLQPTGISEFFYGRETKSGSHSHGSFSSSCQEKCSPILGFMLCGLDTATI